MRMNGSFRHLRGREETVIIPPKRNRKVKRDYDRDLYKSRHLIENFFCYLVIPRHRHPLRQDRAQLSRCNSLRHCHHLA